MAPVEVQEQEEDSVMSVMMNVFAFINTTCLDVSTRYMNKTLGNNKQTSRKKYEADTLHAVPSTRLLADCQSSGQ